MSLRQLIADTGISWDGAWQVFPRGTVVDVPPGSALEAAYGTGNLVDLTPADEASIGAGTRSAVAN
jgi:hypothetical protein